MSGAVNPLKSMFMPNLKRASAVKTTVLPDGYVALFSAPTDYAYTIPPAGAVAWEFFDGDTPIEDVIEEAAQALGVENSSDFSQQILNLAVELQKNGFLEPCC
jgi:hypothetical protein